VAVTTKLSRKLKLGKRGAGHAAGGTLMLRTRKKRSRPAVLSAGNVYILGMR
jgi:hypothetical protein